MSSGLLYAIVGALIDAAITAMTGAYKAWEARNVVFSRFQNCNYRFAAHYREGYERGGVYPFSRSQESKAICAKWVISHEGLGA